MKPGEHLQSLLASKQILQLPPARARELADHIDGLPWNATRLDWGRMSHCLQARIPSAEPDDDFEQFCRSVAIAAEALILVYSKDLAIVGETRWLLRNFDEVIWEAPGRQYLVGADRVAIDCTPILSVVLEYDDVDVLRASVPEAQKDDDNDDDDENDDGHELSPAVIREAETALAQLWEDLSLRHRALWCEGRAATIPEDVLGKYDFSTKHVIASRRWGIADASSRYLGKLFRLERVARFADPDSDPSTATLVRSPLLHTIEALVVEAGRRLQPWFGRVPEVFEWIITDELPTSWSTGYWISTVEWTLEEEVPLEMHTPPVPPGMPMYLWQFVLASARWRVAAAQGYTVTSSYSPPRATVGMRFADLEDPFEPIIDISRCGAVLAATFHEDDPAHIFVHPSTVAAP